ncbi:LITAF domain-containing protein-like [Neosynchiropus ocellatus]
MEKRNELPPSEPAPPYPGLPPAYSAEPCPSTVPVAAYGYGMPAPQVIQTTSQVVMVQPTNASGAMVCPFCHTSVVTNTRYISGALTWLICAIVGIFLCWPCCLIPFCVDSCKDVEHSCPNCQRVLHIHKQI